MSFVEKNPYLKDPWFLAGLLLKVVFLFGVGSSFLRDYFIPFIDQSLLNPGTNPWSLSPPEFFPYGSFLFVVLFIPKWILFQLFGEVALGQSALSFFGMKLPLLIFDFFILKILCSWTPQSQRKIVFYYWLNPILFYITFIHGQLDVVSISLVFLSLYFVLNQRWMTAAMLFAFAALSKFHVIILIPFIAAYIWNTHFMKEALKKLFSVGGLFLVTFVLGSLPILLSSHFNYVTTGSPEAFRVFSAKLILDETHQLFIGLILIFLILGRLVFSTRISAFGLIYGCGLILGSLLFITNPMPGWYYWVVPFLTLFFAHYLSAPRLLMWGLWIFYFFHFILLDFVSVSPLIKSISLSILQALLLSQLLALYFICVKNESRLRNRMKPLLLGLSGDSGTGKNHFSKLIQNVLGEKNCLMIEGDDYHKWERGNENWETITHLNPMANHLPKMYEHAEQMAKGLSIQHHHYDHSTGKFSLPQQLNPTKTIIFQGLHSLYLKGLRDSLDLKIFLNPDENVRLYWKVKRDVSERGYSLEKVLSTIQKRKTDSQNHIQPQKEKSDWIIEICSDQVFDPKTWSQNQEWPLYAKYTLFNDEPISELVELLSKNSVPVDLSFTTQDIDRISLKVSGNPSSEVIASIAEQLFPDLRSLTRGRQAPEFLSGLSGIHQLFLLSLLKRRILNS